MRNLLAEDQAIGVKVRKAVAEYTVSMCNSTEARNILYWLTHDADFDVQRTAIVRRQRRHLAGVAGDSLEGAHQRRFVRRRGPYLVMVGLPVVFGKGCDPVDCRQQMWRQCGVGPRPVEAAIDLRPWQRPGVDRAKDIAMRGQQFDVGPQARIARPDPRVGHGWCGHQQQQRAQPVPHAAHCALAIASARASSTSSHGASPISTACACPARAMIDTPSDRLGDDRPSSAAISSGPMRNRPVS